MNWEEYRDVIREKSVLPEDYYILGIDLGTTNSIISYWSPLSEKPEPIDISNGFGKIPLPSVVQYRQADGQEGEWVIGEEAYRSMKIYPETTIRSIKRKMGSNEKIKVGGKEFLPEEISAIILKELIKHCKSINPKAEIAGVVVSVPYDFDDAAKKATMKACEIAGISENLICLIEEPKAAALAYNFRHQINLNEKIMVFDFGGGTLDITVFHVSEKDENHIKLQVISEGGEANHGGDHVDEAILEKCFQFIEEETKVNRQDIDIDNQVELILRAREAKERLSGVKNYRIPFTFCIPPFVKQLSREDFESLIAAFITKTRKLVLKALREAYNGALQPEDITRVILEGGSCHMPWVKEMLNEIFNDENKIYTSERPALDISLGASYYAAMKMGVLAETDIEAEKYNVEFEVSVPHDIGIEIQQGNKKTFFTMIRRGTSYALAKKSHTFTLAGDTADDMTNFDLRLLERINKDDKHSDCKLIGDIKMQGLPERPSGKTRIAITLTVEEDGGMVKGFVEDLGYGDEYAPSGYKENFAPDRFNETVIG